MENAMLSRLPELLLPWYDANRRQLPWRADREPYHVWLSEIMLQQTRVEAVRGYYACFLAELPDIASLASAEEEQLGKLWEGLGYYSRVRNMKKAARMIMERHNGVFPQDYPSVRALPGVGDYTAGAICSICFDQPEPAVDGNVLRLFSRLCNDHTPIERPELKSAVRELLRQVYPKRAGDFTQALMELGATVCGPNKKPQCQLCPCREICAACALGTAEQLPVRTPKTKRREEDRTVFIAVCDGRFALRKRPSKGLLAGLWEFPNVQGKLETADALEAAADLGLRPKALSRQVERKHIFTHIQWNMRGIYLEAAEQSGEFVWMTPEQINTQAALPTAFRQFWEELTDV